MPSNFHRVSAAFATICLFTGGAWLASELAVPTPQTAASSTGEASDAGLVVTLHGVRDDNGQIVVMAFDNAAAFDALDYESAAGYIALPASTSPQRVDFPDLNRNYYAIVAFHDENNDFVLNTDENWIPQEGYAISGLNDLMEAPVFEYSLISPGFPVDLAMFYWRRQRSADWF